MAKQLRTFVHVHTPDDGTVVYGPDDTIPARHAKLITNPKCWVDESPAEDEGDSSNQG